MMRRKHQTLRIVLKATTVQMKTKQKGEAKMEDERIKVVIFNGISDETRFVKLTPEQVKFLEWLQDEGFLYGYSFETNVQFESI